MSEHTDYLPDVLSGIQNDCLQALVVLAMFGDDALACARYDEPAGDSEEVVWYPGGNLDVRLSRKASAIVRALDKVALEIIREDEENTREIGGYRLPAHYDLTTLSNPETEDATAEERCPR